MSNDFIIEAELRGEQGKGASRRLRRLEGKVPAILYGEDKDPVNLSVIAKDLAHSLENEAFFSHVLTVKYDGQEQAAILKDLQRHPAKGYVVHADFLRISKNTELHVNVPLHFINEEACKGVKLGGGKIQHQLTDVEVSCLPKDLPEYIEVDMTAVELDAIVHLSDLVLPKGVTLVALTHGEDHNLPVASVHKLKGATEEASEEESGEE